MLHKLAFRRANFRVLDAVANIFFECMARIYLPPKRDVLLLVRLDNIGDFVLWLECANAIRIYFREKFVVLVANRTFADLAEASGYFDKVVPVDVTRFSVSRAYRLCTKLFIRKLRASIAIHPTFSRALATGDTCIKSSFATTRIGSVGDLTNISASNRAVSDKWYTQLLPATTQPLMEIERNFEFIRGLGITDYMPSVAHIKHVATLPDDIPTSSKYFVVFPGASSPIRQWPAASFALVARSIAERYGWKIVICGSESESYLATQIAQLVDPISIVDLSGKTSLAQLVEVIRNAQLLIGNETSGVHIAAAVDTASVCVLGGGHFKRFLPYPSAVNGPKPLAVFHAMPCFNCNWRCTLPHEAGGRVPCISSVTVEDVLVATSQLLSGCSPS
jgi:ADP-heptose:LPS heptosyltransferase